MAWEKKPTTLALVMRVAHVMTQLIGALNPQNWNLIESGIYAGRWFAPGDDGLN